MRSTEKRLAETIIPRTTSGFAFTCHREAIRARSGNGFEGLTTPLEVEQVWI